MRSRTTISPEGAADRLTLSELFDAYARCADRRDAQGQLALFTEDTRFVVYMDAKAADPTQELHGRDALASIRYLDQFVKLDGTWYFAERNSSSTGPTPVLCSADPSSCESWKEPL